MKLSFGRAPAPQDLNLDPIEVELVGYDVDRNEVSRTFRFRPMRPLWRSLEIARVTSVDGEVPTSEAIKFLDACVLGDDQESWREFLDDPDVFIDHEAIVDLMKGIVEVYNNRPTERPSGSSGGPTDTGATMPPAAPLQDSGSPTSTPQTG